MLSFRNEGICRLLQQYHSFLSKELCLTPSRAPLFSPSDRAFDGPARFVEVVQPGQALREIAQMFGIPELPAASLAGLECWTHQCHAQGKLAALDEQLGVPTSCHDLPQFRIDARRPLAHSRK